jgi:hypothetical protein
MTMMMQQAMNAPGVPAACAIVLAIFGNVPLTVMPEPPGRETA